MHVTLISTGAGAVPVLLLVLVVFIFKRSDGQQISISSCRFLLKHFFERSRYKNHSTIKRTEKSEGDESPQSSKMSVVSDTESNTLTKQQAVDTSYPNTGNTSIAHDIIAHGTDDNHDDRVDGVLKTRQTKGLTASLEQCIFGMDRLVFTGHVLPPLGLQPAEDKIEAMKK